MKKVLFFTLVCGIASCRQNDPGPQVPPSQLADITGAYMATVEDTPRTSYYRWVVVPGQDDKLGIGMFIEDRIRFGGSEAPIREIYMMQDVTLSADSTLEINERVTSGTKPVNIKGSGRINWNSNGDEVETINMTLEYLNDDSSEVRPSETYTFQKLKDEAAIIPEESFDFAGNYSTMTIDNLKSSNHAWVVADEGNNMLSIDYAIDESVGGISQSKSNFALRDIKLAGQNSFMIDEEVTETNREDNYRIQAFGTKVVWPEAPKNRIAVVILLTNTSKNIRRMEYMDFKKD